MIELAAAMVRDPDAGTAVPNGVAGQRREIHARKAPGLPLRTDSPPLAAAAAEASLDDVLF
ncbi:hypothetical protein CH341_24830 [Rhodoplanes roseus]|uniref:Uncharacterized protein n=1 Tax=Rhodoplanes roseus TaxID=29409 RepID=A0A327KRK1_9BRAD